MLMVRTILVSFYAASSDVCTDTPINQIPTEELGYNAAILYLIADNRLREIMLSLSYVYRWVPMHPWPIILFYASDMDDPSSRNDFMMRLYDFLGGGEGARHFIQRLEWIRLHWTLPEGFSHDVHEVRPIWDFVWPGTSSYHATSRWAAGPVSPPSWLSLTPFISLFQATT